jgi:hypothetical protein
MKFRIVFWDVLPCKIIVDRRFRVTCCLNHQGSLIVPIYGLALSIGPNRVGVFYLVTETPVSEMLCGFDQRLTMDNVQKVCHFNNTPPTQTFRIYLRLQVVITHKNQYTLYTLSFTETTYIIYCPAIWNQGFRSDYTKGLRHTTPIKRV